MSSPVAAAARCRAVPCSFCGGSPYRARETEPCTCSLERSSSRSVPVVGQNSVATLDSSRQRSEAGRQLPLVFALLGALSAALGARSDLVLENLALRQQLALLRRRAKRPRFGQLDRLFWMWLSQRWARWREALHVVQPQTVIRWHRQGFRAFWNRKSRRGRTGRPPVDSEIAKLVRTMALANPLLGAPHSWRAPQARARRLTTHGWSAHASPCETALADLADLPRKSRRRSCIGRLLRRAHGDVPRALRVRSPPPSPPPSRTFQRDRLPYRGLDGAAGCRGLPPRLGAPVSHPRSRRHLRRTVSTTGEGHRSCRGPHRAALPVAEPFR